MGLTINPTQTIALYFFGGALLTFAISFFIVFQSLLVPKRGDFQMNHTRRVSKEDFDHILKESIDVSPVLVR